MYRILWTRPDTEGGWYNDIDAPDQAQAVWQVAVNTGPGPASLISVTDLNPPQPAQE